MASANEKAVGGPEEGSAMEPSNQQPVPGHIPMADRVSLQSWGTGSGPSLPDIDSEIGVRKLEALGKKQKLVAMLTSALT